MGVAQKGKSRRNQREMEKRRGTRVPVDRGTEKKTKRRGSTMLGTHERSQHA